MTDEQYLTFGADRENDRAAAYARYAMGDPVSVIASDMNKSESAILAMMRERPEEYEETKKKREDFTGVRVNRSLSLVDATRLRLLEILAEEKDLKNELRDKDSVVSKLLNKLGEWEKSLSHRHQLYQGKATDIVKHEEVRTIEDVEQKIKEIKDAGDGLAVE